MMGCAADVPGDISTFGAGYICFPLAISLAISLANTGLAPTGEE